ncbi:Endonuclease [Mucinivorans hirudinis]|uniref:UPF0102 protein BN938_1022 n=1 Tax=Mucinivorans hirudinis TaxID=1433126 RepID=A0A060R7D2_9BACT|nr:Endonuclease [Mucinivorans hirudinis]
MSRQQTGSRGEQIAADYLRAQGYEIVEQNYRTGHLEVDVIAERDGALYLVEVKTRVNSGAFKPELALTRAKMDRIARAAENYIREKSIDKEVFIEMITVDITHNGELIRHYKHNEF